MTAHDLGNMEVVAYGGEARPGEVWAVEEEVVERHRRTVHHHFAPVALRRDEARALDVHIEHVV